MSDYVREQKLKRKREYYRKWRAEHPESVREANIRYWARKAAELNKTAAIPGNAEIRREEE